MKVTVGVLSLVWTGGVVAVAAVEFFSTQAGGTIIAAIILTLVPLIGQIINGWFTRRRQEKADELAKAMHAENVEKFATIEKKVDGAASVLAASEKASTELAKAVETGRVKELQATIEELRKQLLQRGT